MNLKKSKKIFNELDLPSNRKEAFFDALQVRFGTLLRSSLLTFLFFVPIILVFLAKELNIVSLYNSIINEEIPSEELSTRYFSILIMSDVFVLITSFIASIGISGFIRVIRQIVWLEPVFFHKDYLEGVKLNYKQVSLATFVLALVFCLADIAQFSPLESEFIKALPLGLFFIAVVPVYLFNVAGTSVYSNKFSKLTKNSIILYINSLPYILIFILLIVGFWCMKFISYMYVKYILLLVIIIFLLPLYGLAFFLFASKYFDKCININFYPELVDKGIVRKK